MYPSHGTWVETSTAIFAEPSRAIMRNIIVIAVGFLPLLLAPLTPYKTVGALLAAILFVSGAATLLLLPALLKVLEKSLFKIKPVAGQCCNCIACALASITLVVLIALTLRSFTEVSWSGFTWLAVIVVPLMAIGCGLMSRREKCKILN